MRQIRQISIGLAALTVKMLNFSIPIVASAQERGIRIEQDCNYIVE